MPDFVDSALKDIDERLRMLKDEASRLEAARAALTGGTRQRRRAGAAAGGAHASRTRGRSATRRSGRSAEPRSASGGNTRAEQALELVRSKPGITIPEIARAMKIQPNYLYRVLPGLASVGQIKREGQGWHPATASTSTRPGAKASRQRAARSAARTSTTGSRSRRRATRSATTNGRTAHGATKASVLAALAGGEAMTASQVATKAGLARPTVSTTLSKLAKSGEVQKADRGYRLGATA